MLNRVYLTGMIEFVACKPGSGEVFSLGMAAVKRGLLTIFFCALGFLSSHSVWAAQTRVHPIVFGMSTALHGPTAELGRHMQTGVLAGFARINRQGGIHGRALELLTLDDGYEPSRTAPNMRQLIERERVLGVIGNVGTPTAIAALPIVRTTKTLFFAPFTGAGLLRRDPPERYIINYRASYAQEISAMVEALVEKGKLRPAEIAFFTQRDGYGDAGYVAGAKALQRYGVKSDRDVLHVRYERNTLAVENALADILFSPVQPKAIIMVGAYAPCAKFIKLARENGLKALFLNVSFVGSSALLEQLQEAGEGVVITQVVPPLSHNDLPIVRDYLADLQTYAPKESPNDVSFEGYVAARIVILALEKIPDYPTREGLIDALEGLGEFDLGFGQPLYLSPQSHQASPYVWPTLIHNGKIVPFRWEDMATLLRKAGAS